MSKRKLAQQRNEFTVKITRELYRGVDGRLLSLQGRKRQQEQSQSSSISSSLQPQSSMTISVEENQLLEQSESDTKSQSLSISDSVYLTYGEIVPSSFIQILNSIKLNESHKVFVDLGCGTGVALMTAAFSSCEFRKVWGIELLPELLNAATSVAETLASSIIRAKDVPIKKVTTETLPSSSSSIHSELNQVIETVFQSEASNELSIEVLVNLICKKIGHREYKKLLKGCKSFKKFLTLYPTIYNLLDDERVQLNQPETLEDLTKEEPTHTDESDPKGCDEGPSGRSFRPEVVNSLLQSPIGVQICNSHFPVVQLDCGDIFVINWWEEADIVYCSSLLFSDEMMTDLLERVWNMKPKSFFISLKSFPSNHFVGQGESIHQNGGNGRKLTLVSDSFYRMSWQMARVYIYQLRDDV